MFILVKIQPVKKVLSIVSILFCLYGYGQSNADLTPKDSIKPAYLRFPTVPPFEILEVDSLTTFTKEDLKKNQQLLLMYFSPDCDHCRHQTEDLLHDIRSFKKIQIVMATYQPFDLMKEFYQKYKLANYNIHVGRDSKFILPPFYRMANLPYLALYDKKGNLITTFEGNQKVNKILKAFGKEE
jgi:thioredoxin-related protein